jgi:hypothetical protein
MEIEFTRDELTTIKTALGNDVHRYAHNTMMCYAVLALIKKVELLINTKTGA